MLADPHLSVLHPAVWGRSEFDSGPRSTLQNQSSCCASHFSLSLSLSTHCCNNSDQHKAVTTAATVAAPVATWHLSAASSTQCVCVCMVYSGSLLRSLFTPLVVLFWISNTANLSHRSCSWSTAATLPVCWEETSESLQFSAFYPPFSIFLGANVHIYQSSKIVDKCCVSLVLIIVWLLLWLLLMFQ